MAIPAKLKKIYQNKLAVAPLVRKIGVAATGALLKEIDEPDLKKYLYDFCDKEFTQNRIKITAEKFCLAFLGKSSTYIKYKDMSLVWLVPIINEVIDDVYEKQKKLFCLQNNAQMDLERDIWRLYFMKGPSLNKRDFNFSKINKIEMRYEVKMYYRDLLKNERNFRDDRGIALLTAGINFMTDCNPRIRRFADISVPDISNLIVSLQNGKIKTQFNDNYSVSSIRKMIQRMSAVTEYLIARKGYVCAPKGNQFDDYSFNNTKCMEKNTDCIPEEVVVNINNHIGELTNEYRLMYRLMVETGLHAKEISFLKRGDIIPSQYEEYYRLTYIQYKNEWRSRFSGYDAHKITLISTSLAKEVLEYINNTEDVRKLSGEDYIFISKRVKGSTTRFTLPQMAQFVAAINRIIKNHNITTETGELWHFTSRQVRKTIAVQMAENGATATEIAIRLAHSDTKTTEKYYAEVRRKRLAELNSEFFKKKFAIFVGEENLSQYTEKERKDLYVEFSLNLREVELGQCSRHLSDGPCGRTGHFQCATCPKICTGLPYLDKWQKILDSQNQRIKELEKLYYDEAISENEYKEFLEYKRELMVRNRAKSIIDSIRGDRNGN